MAQAAGVALIGAGTGLKFQGIAEEASADRREFNAIADAKRLEALEILDRSDVNKSVIQAEGEKLKGEQKLTFAARGIDIGEGTPLSIIEETNSEILRQIIIEEKEAQLKSRKAFNEAEAARLSSREVSRREKREAQSAALGAFGSFLGGAS